MFVKVVAPLLAVLWVVASDNLLGAPEDVDINSPEVQDALRFAVAQYNEESDSIYTSQVVQVIKAQAQVRYFIGLFVYLKLIKIHTANDTNHPFLHYVCVS